MKLLESLVYIGRRIERYLQLFLGESVASDIEMNARGLLFSGKWGMGKAPIAFWENMVMRNTLIIKSKLI